MSESQLQRLGVFLKARREKRGVDLQDVEGATSIRLNFLRAIEEGNIEDLIDSAYARGFIKQYATFLGMDGERAVRDLKRPGSQKLGDFHYGIGCIERRREAGPSSKFAYRSLTVGLVLAGGIILWQLLRHFAAG